MSPQVCYLNCRGKGYNYFGLQYKSECYCGNDPFRAGKAGSEGECDTPCLGASNTACGGTWRNSVYKMTTTKAVADNTLETSDATRKNKATTFIMHYGAAVVGVCVVIVIVSIFVVFYMISKANSKIEGSI